MLGLREGRGKGCGVSGMNGGLGLDLGGCVLADGVIGLLEGATLLGTPVLEPYLYLERRKQWTFGQDTS